MALKKKKKKKKTKSSHGNITTNNNTNNEDKDDNNSNAFFSRIRRIKSRWNQRRNSSTFKEDFVAFCSNKTTTKRDDTDDTDDQNEKLFLVDDVVSQESISDQTYAMSRAYKIDRLGAKLALDLALGKQTEVRRVFEALRGGESKGKEDDDEEDEEEEERTMFERVFGDGCKKVPKSNDVRFRAPLEALREALDVVDTLEEKKRRKRKKNGEEGGRSGDDGESRASSEYD